MRQSRACFFLLLPLLLICAALFLPGCGGGANVANIIVTPSPASVAYGQTVQLNVTAESGNGAQLPTTFTFSSDNPNITVSPSGGDICGGTWTVGATNVTDYTVCNPPSGATSCPSGLMLVNGACPAVANITIKAVTGGGSPVTMQVYMHEQVDRVQINSASGPQIDTTDFLPGNCLSAGKTAAANADYQATAQSTNASVCNQLWGSPAVPCTVPPLDLTAGNATANPFTWTSTDTTIATVDSNGLVTAVTPGQTNIFASTNGATSASIPFVTCPVTSISLPSTPTTISPNATQTTTATVTDRNGTQLVQPLLPTMTWFSTNQNAATVAAKTASSSTTSNGVTTTANVQTGTATITGGTAGTATLAVSCSPPNCNKNMFPVYSNPVLVKSSGAPATELFIASTQSQYVVTFTASGGALGYIAIGTTPNSFQMNRQGALGTIGSDSTAAVVFNPAPKTSSTTTSTTPSTASAYITAVQFNGAVMNISPDGTLAAFTGNVPGNLQAAIGIVTLSSGAVVSFPIAGTVTAADFSPDSQFLWVTTQETSGATTTNRLYTYQISGTAAGATVMTLPNTAAGAGLDVAFLPNGPVAYVTSAAANTNVTAYATCFATPPNHIAADDTQNTGTNTAINVRTFNFLNSSGAAIFGAAVLSTPNPGPGSPNIDVIEPVNSTLSGSSACPTAADVGFPENKVLTASLGAGAPASAGDVNQFLITPDGSRVVVTSKTTGNIVVFNLQTGTLQSAITLANGATLNNGGAGFKGAITVDGSSFYVGASDLAIHEVDLVNGTGDTVVVPSASLAQEGLALSNGNTASPDFVVIGSQ